AANDNKPAPAQPQTQTPQPATATPAPAPAPAPTPAATTTAAPASTPSPSGGVGGGAQGSTPGADFIKVRDPGPEQKQLDDGVKKRSVDPDPPPPASQQVDQIKTPGTTGLQTTGAAHAQGVNEEKAKVPPPQGIYDTVKPLPTLDTPTPPKPLAAGGM